MYKLFFGLFGLTGDMIGQEDAMELVVFFFLLGLGIGIWMIKKEVVKLEIENEQLKEENCQLKKEIKNLEKEN